MIHQELQLFPDLTVRENLFVGRERCTRWGTVAWDAQEDAARLTEIRSAGPARSAGAMPPKGPDRKMLALDRKLERELLICVLAHPSLAREVPAEIVDDSHAEGRALAALIGLEGIEQLEHAAILEAMRDSEHEALLNRLDGELLERRMEASVAQAEFMGAITALRMRNPNLRIRELGEKDAKEGLSVQERDEFLRLIDEDAALKQRRMPPSPML